MLHSIFKDNVSRPIETVIKADDRDHILQEVEEYVITAEISKKIRGFFSEYNNYSGVNGVWISGFFGSGKSHLLKILSYILENKTFDGKPLSERFADKIEDDQLLKADVLKATKIPAESILFNIDQQSQITTKGDEDAVLNVFYKVLNDHIGYFGGQRHVAEFERWVDSEGNYETFKENYEKEAGESWIEGRRKYFAPKVKENVAKVLSDINGDDAANYHDIFNTLQRDNRISVEDFCEKVNQYIGAKPTGFRLNFFVDEVGQYISDNTKLMLNIQTISETLATRCKGKAWLLVTSQEDLERVVGDESRAQSNDFSKIQGRFKIRIPLTSANVDEVIEKRLLRKNESAEKELLAFYKKEKANIETILSFSDVGMQFRKFKNEQDFINKYPFVPYQFDLFQQCIKELSKHNAFQGKHASVGERSMLGVFQEVLKRMENTKEQVLVSFDQMFEGIRSTIKGEFQNAIMLAENNLNNPLAVRVLKALFLVKYFSNFKTNVRNISVLMLDSPNVDLQTHEKAIKEALNVLESQTYIQRNGDFYEFLTDDEKDIEQEIKSTEIDSQLVTEFLSSIIYDDIIGDSRIQYSENKQFYEFTRRIDGMLLSKERELEIDILTPNNENYEHESYAMGQTMGRATKILFKLPPHERIIKDARLYLQTERYIKHNNSTSNKISIRRILQEKGQLNAERKRELSQLIRGLLGESTVYLNGTEHKMPTSSDGKIKVFNAFQDLVKLAYPSLRMLGKEIYSEQTFAQVMTSRQDDLFNADEQGIGEAENEVYNFILRRKKQSDRTTLSDLRDQFSKKPYGWYQNATWTVIAKLFKRGKIEAKQDGNILSDDELLSNLRNNRMFANTLFEPQVDFDHRLVKQLKDTYQDMFDEPCSENDARDIANAFKDKAEQTHRRVKDLREQTRNYPFLKSLEPLSNLLETISRYNYHEIITNLKSYEDELLNAKEDVLDPIRKFMQPDSDQRKIFDQIRPFIQGNQSNFEYIETPELALLSSVHEHEKPYVGSILREAKDAIEKLKTKVTERISAERSQTIEAIKSLHEKIENHPDFKKLNEFQQRNILEPFTGLIHKSYQQNYIAQLMQYRTEARDELYTNALNHIQTLLAKANEPKVEYINKSEVLVVTNKTELATEADVEEYVAALKKEMLRQIQNNKRISL